tara:strand:+ start:990 stop:1178 length:189 start_codon:yes stop_codon:yes gene_type:complete
MLWFFIGFIFGLFVAQESPTFPNIKRNAKKAGYFIYDLITTEAKEFVDARTDGGYPTRSKSE